MSPQPSAMDTVLASLVAVSERVSMQERTIGDRIDQIAEGQAELRGVVQANVARTEDVAKKLHDLRNDLAEQNVLKPERARELQNRETRAIIDEAMAKMMPKMLARMEADQVERDRRLKWGGAAFLAIGTALAATTDWLAAHVDGVVAFLKLWKGNP